MLISTLRLMQGISHRNNGVEGFSLGLLAMVPSDAMPQNGGKMWGNPIFPPSKLGVKSLESVSLYPNDDLSAPAFRPYRIANNTLSADVRGS